MIKLIKNLIKFIIIVFILLVILVVWYVKKEDSKPSYSKPEIVDIQEDSKFEDEELQEVVEEAEPEVVKEEVVYEDGVRPEFRRSMESFEEFFDEYIEFMNDFKQDSTSLSMVAKYAEFLAKYEKTMSELDKIDETELTDAEDRLYIETQLRINNKLTQAAIDY